jgi:damage-control phosphatase, subfamily III
MSHDDIAHLQTVGKDAQAERLKYILKDDQDLVISYLESLTDHDARVDFVLDNGTYLAFYSVKMYTESFSKRALRFGISFIFQ